MGNFNYKRNLCNKDSALQFAENILELEGGDAEEAAYKIKKAEMLLDKTKNESSINNPNERVEAYKSDANRKKLHKQIIQELFTLPRLDNDEEICLGKNGGGALPINGCVKSERNAYIITGLPASGKSTFSSRIADKYGAIIIDCDYAKRKLPEFSEIDAEYATNFVHEESSEIVMGAGNINSLIAQSYRNEYNMIIPKIGYNAESIYKFAKFLNIDCGYKVHLLLVSLDRKQATQRAYERYKKTKRYVPLSLIFDSYANDTILTYYRLRTNTKYSKAFKSFGKISTDVEIMEVPKYIHSTQHSPIKNQNSIIELYQ